MPCLSLLRLKPMHHRRPLGLLDKLSMLVCRRGLSVVLPPKISSKKSWNTFSRGLKHLPRQRRMVRRRYVACCILRFLTLFFLLYFIFKIKQWLRENRSTRKKRITKIVKAHYWPDAGKPKLQSLQQVEAELDIHRSDDTEHKLASAMTVSAIATSMWSSDKRSDAEYKWVRQQVCNKFSVGSRY